MKIRTDVDLANLTDTGNVRPENEDYYCYLEPAADEEFERKGRLIAIADGMGGHAGGKVASTLALDSLRAVFENGSAAEPADTLISGFARAQQSILGHVELHPELAGMGTTCTAAILHRGNLSYGHIGDSRLYLLRAGSFGPVTEDHSLVNQLVQSGALTPEQAAGHQQKNVLTRALGMPSSDVAADFSNQPISLSPGDVLVLATDGLHGVVSTEEIGHAAQTQSPYDACRTLVAIAKERGGLDNITVQILRLRAGQKNNRTEYPQ
jgi:PPM family protein phosphatase